ncbi:uncharacterized protein LOC136085920 isoform X1 [Hydra vulgaris]|uniref:Uncharacterized protein LOC136085920 isoform X1 n=1 Tax=Hydra vulgaris TaxID=6087 RepID=A0ABM4CPY6_HYDVU
MSKFAVIQWSRNGSVSVEWDTSVLNRAFLVNNKEGDVRYTKLANRDEGPIEKGKVICVVDSLEEALLKKSSLIKKKKDKKLLNITNEIENTHTMALKEDFAKKLTTLYKKIERLVSKAEGDLSEELPRKKAKMLISQPPTTHSKPFPLYLQPTNSQIPPPLSQTLPVTPSFSTQSQSKQFQSFSTNDSINDHPDSSLFLNNHNSFHENSFHSIDFNQLQSENIQLTSNSFQTPSPSFSLPAQLYSVPQMPPPLLHSQPTSLINSHLPLSMHSQLSEQVPAHSLVSHTTQPTDYICSDKEVTENMIPKRVLTAPSGKKLVKQLLGYFYERNKLVNASLSGKKASSKFSVSKKVGLDPAVLHLITELTISKFSNFSKNDVSVALCEKINDERRAYFKAAPKTQTEKNASSTI